MCRSFTKVIVQLFAVVQIAIVARVALAQTKVACIGDSITALPSSWCGDLSTKLGAGYNVSNFGVSGTNLEKSVGQPYWDSAQYQPSHDFAPDIVIIMLGTNDAQPTVWSAGMSHFIQDYEDLLDTYTSLASHPTPYIILPTPIGYSPFGHDGTLIPSAIIPDIKQVAMVKGVPTVDAFTAFGGTAADAGAFDTSLYGTSDQVHPNAQGQQIICDLVYAALMSPGGPGDAGTGGSPDSGGSGDAGGGGMTGGSGGAGSGGMAGGSGGAGSGGMAGGSGGGAGSGGMAGGSGGTGGAGGGAGTMNASSGAGGGGANTGGSAGLPDAGGSGNTGGNSSGLVDAMAASGTSAAPGSTPASSGSGCRIAGNATSKSGPAAGLLLLFAIAMRRKEKLLGAAPLTQRPHP
jgi:acyl-CoA thioesterase-1